MKFRLEKTTGDVHSAHEFGRSTIVLIEIVWKTIIETTFDRPGMNRHQNNLSRVTELVVSGQ